MNPFENLHLGKTNEPVFPESLSMVYVLWATVRLIPRVKRC